MRFINNNFVIAWVANDTANQSAIKYSGASTLVNAESCLVEWRLTKSRDSAGFPRFFEFSPPAPYTFILHWAGECSWLRIGDLQFPRGDP
jgi:hypothetical protein